MAGFRQFESGDFGSPPYHDSSWKAILRAAALGLGGLGNVRRGAGPFEAIATGFAGGYSNASAAQQAAQEYAMKQQQMEEDRQYRDIQGKALEAQIEQMKRPPKPEKDPVEELRRILGREPTPKEREIAAGVYKEPPKPTETKTEPIVAVIGKDGKPVYVKQSQALGMTPAPSGGEKTTAVERRSSGALNRASRLSQNATDLEKTFKTQDLFQLKAPYLAQSQKQKNYTNAKKAFTETVLREFSGAAISKDEYAKYDDIFFAQPGDNADILKDKQATRDGILEQLRTMSGSAAREMGREGLDNLLGVKAGSAASQSDRDYIKSLGIK